MATTLSDPQEFIADDLEDLNRVRRTCELDWKPLNRTLQTDVRLQHSGTAFERVVDTHSGGQSYPHNDRSNRNQNDVEPRSISQEQRNFSSPATAAFGVSDEKPRALI